MLFVLYKEKIISYLVAFSTVAILLFISAITTKQPETVLTSSNIVLEEPETIQKNVIQGD